MRNHDAAGCWNAPIHLPPEIWQSLLHGEIESIFLRAGCAVPEPPKVAERQQLVFPGSFNPLHQGHLAMAQAARERTGAAVEFEIAIVNVEKPPVDGADVRRRIGQFATNDVVWLTRAATFAAKSQLFRSACFLVGADTMARIVDPRYYADSRDFQASLDSLLTSGCRFLVYGRQHGGRFQTLADIPLPRPLREVCEGVPQRVFRHDISSSQVRSGVARP